MSRFWNGLKQSYIYLILVVTYIPLIFAVVFSFNKPSAKGFLSFTWNQGTNEAWVNFFADDRGNALVNSIIIALFTAIFVVIISLVTVYAMWRQKNKKYGVVIKSVNNIPLINPDNITAIGLVLVFSMLFGTLASTKEGLARGIVGHTLMALPYGITLMYPRSEKFNRSLMEASQDLGYSKFRSWFKTYFVYMIPSIIFSALVAAFLSFDDFIILRTTTNTVTLGTKLYEGQFQAWGLVVGAALMFLTIFGNIIYISYKAYNLKKGTKLKNKKGAE
ncbi:ABC transporter permease [Mycoplasmopsis columbina]|uniref:Spermidine/putrescine abc transporter permeaseprotein potc n=1 Tax=Mycoplasmopsis columbina SF7 TaxID=1037410 RepID=F9UJX6_9BACT|nr:ABC transporter permease subunit [Mycoplasmopsis columbina]EGV00322.1 spermidine/putrescine abc transporter permeaseprotein potc [Mycoplasmopsis columbina SF7]VEU76813.1 spermidine/putrescine ABC transporter membrane protein [Mycoplasmopsis columbina]